MGKKWLSRVKASLLAVAVMASSLGEITDGSYVKAADSGQVTLDLTTVTDGSVGYTSDFTDEKSEESLRVNTSIEAMVEAGQIGAVKDEELEAGAGTYYVLDLNKDGKYDVLYLSGEMSFIETFYMLIISVVNTRSIENEFVLTMNDAAKAKAEASGKDYFSSLKFIFPAPHVHEWSSEWSSDEKGHYHECNALLCPATKSEEKGSFAKHTYGEWEIIKAATASAKGERKHTCKICGYVEKQEYALGQENEPTEGSVKKGSTFTDSKTKAKYKITSTGKKNTVTYVAPLNKNAVSISVPDTVKSGGVTYQVTAIAANACKSNKKLSRLTIGKWVSVIGKEAFSDCSGLKNIIVKTALLKANSVGAGAFKKINKKAKAKVPAKCLKSYKKIFKKKGMNGKKQKVTK